MGHWPRLAALALCAVMVPNISAASAETPKRGGTLTFMIPADAPPSFDGRIVPHRSYVKGWKTSPSHFINQDLSMVWLDR